MFGVIASHVKAIALCGTLAGGAVYGTHAAYTHHHNHHVIAQQTERRDDGRRFDRGDRPEKPQHVDRYDRDFGRNR